MKQTIYVEGRQPGQSMKFLFWMFSRAVKTNCNRCDSLQPGKLYCNTQCVYDCVHRCKGDDFPGLGFLFIEGRQPQNGH